MEEEKNTSEEEFHHIYGNEWFTVFLEANESKNDYTLTRCIDLSKTGEIAENLILNEIEMKEIFTNPQKNIMEKKEIVRTESDEEEQAEEEKTLIIYFGFCNGGSLRSYLMKKKIIPEQEARDILKQILEGIEYLRSKNVILRCLMPECILFHNNIIKIADYGFAVKEDSNPLEDYNFFGNRLYLSPEILNNQPYTNKCDIWSTGLIFYEMLFGVNPAENMDAKDLLNLQISVPDQLMNISSIYFLRTAIKGQESSRGSWEKIFGLFLNKENHKQNSILSLNYINDTNQSLSKSVSEQKQGGTLSNTSNRSPIKDRCINKFRTPNRIPNSNESQTQEAQVSNNYQTTSNLLNQNIFPKIEEEPNKLRTPNYSSINTNQSQVKIVSSINDTQNNAPHRTPNKSPVRKINQHHQIIEILSQKQGLNQIQEETENRMHLITEEKVEGIQNEENPEIIILDKPPSLNATKSLPVDIKMCEEIEEKSSFTKTLKLTEKLDNSLKMKILNKNEKVISKKEFIKLVGSIYGDKISPKKAEICYDALDINKRGLVDTEFIKGFILDYKYIISFIDFQVKKSSKIDSSLLIIAKYIEMVTPEKIKTNVQYFKPVNPKFLEEYMDFYDFQRLVNSIDTIDHLEESDLENIYKLINKKNTEYIFFSDFIQFFKKLIDHNQGKLLNEKPKSLLLCKEFKKSLKNFIEKEKINLKDLLEQLNVPKSTDLKLEHISKIAEKVHRKLSKEELRLLFRGLDVNNQGKIKSENLLK